MQKVQFQHKLLPDGESQVIKIGFRELSYELRGDADFVRDAFREISSTETFVGCVAAALQDGVTGPEIVNAMRLGNVPEDQVREFERMITPKEAAAL